MHDHNATLKVLLKLVKESSNPTQYSCQLSEIIAHHNHPWDNVMSDLKLLAKDELIIYVTPVAVTITQKGLSKAQSQDHQNRDVGLGQFGKVA